MNEKDIAKTMKSKKYQYVLIPDRPFDFLYTKTEKDINDLKIYLKDINFTVLKIDDFLKIP